MSFLESNYSSESIQSGQPFMRGCVRQNVVPSDFKAIHRRGRLNIFAIYIVKCRSRIINSWTGAFDVNEIIWISL